MRKAQRNIKRKHTENSRNCYNCNNCEYIGEGGYMCSASDDFAIIIEDWQPTEAFNFCKGKKFENI